MDIPLSRIRLRRLRETDLEAFYAYRSDAAVCAFQSFSPYSRERCRVFLAEQKDAVFGTPGEWLQLGIARQEDDCLIGDLALKLEALDTRVVEIGFTLSRRAQGLGFAREAVAGILTDLFRRRGIHRVFAIVDVENHSAIRLLEALSFRREGHTMQSFFNKGEWRDEYLYALLAVEWTETAPGW